MSVHLKNGRKVVVRYRTSWTLTWAVLAMTGWGAFWAEHTGELVPRYAVASLGGGDMYAQPSQAQKIVTASRGSAVDLWDKTGKVIGR